MNLDDVGKLVRRHRVPIILGAGGVVAYTAFQRSQAERAAAAAAAPVPVAGLDPTQVAGLIGQGSSIAIGAQGPILGLAQESITGGLNLAGLAAQSAAGVADVAVGGAVAGSMALADVLGTLVGVLPDFSPIGGIQPQPTQPTTTPPPSGGGTQPPPASQTTTRNVALGYRVYLRPGARNVAIFSGSCARFTGSRMIQTDVPWSQPASRSACDASRVAWRIGGGGYTGWHFLSWRPEGAAWWGVQKGTRIETYVNGRRTSYRDVWANIGQTSS